MRFASAVLSMVVAVVLLFSGVIHAAQPYYFVHTIASYRLLPPGASGLLGLWLPYLQIVLAMCIGLGMVREAAFGVAVVLFATFAAVQIAVLARGMEIDCGCFGFIVRVVSPASVMLPIAMMSASVLGLVEARRSRRQSSA
ncbi:MAG TPA: MauE/DoxX family redox-associated membrane protein [Pirellulales bacterium]|nr:MauE/DoxX family redox-associated membrane protein [Pirellulales bacterium]